MTGYEVFVNGASLGTAPATNRTVGGLVAATTHSAYVRARDAAGNWSVPSATISVTTLADTAAPTVPTGLVASAVTGEGFTVSWDESTDDSGSVVYEVLLGGAPQGVTAQTTRTFTGLQPQTVYSVSVRAGDPSGNWSAESDAISVETLAGSPESYSIAAGLNTVALTRGDGTVWRWGGNGDSSPTRIEPITTAIKVAASDGAILILQQGGTVLASGSGGSGQTYDGTPTTPISGLSGITGISLGLLHAIAVKSDGSVYGWGANEFGQVGAGKIGANVPPTKLKQVSGVADVVAGHSHSLARKSNGTVIAWGLNSSGQLGDGSTTNRSAPVTVPGLTGIVALAAGGSHSLALRSDGTVWAWGANAYGQLGDGTMLSRPTPVQVVGLANVVAIAAGAEHSLALRADGSLWSWGSNASFQLGIGADEDRSSPAPVILVSGVIGCVASGYASFAEMSDGTIRSWGGRVRDQFTQGQRWVLGDGSIRVITPPFEDVVQLTGERNRHMLALRRDGSVWGWGSNGTAELGDGTLHIRRWPVRAAGMGGVVQIEPGIALHASGSVFTWGGNSRGELGDGTTAERLVPGVVPVLSGVVQIAAGSQHRLALKADGTVWAWGYNEHGQIGDGTNLDRWSPVHVPGLANIVWIAAGGHNSFAVRSDGTVWSWGYDWWASGTNTEKPESVPLQALVSGVTRVATSGRATLFLTASGSVYACGADNVGVGPWYGTPVPLLIPELQGIVEISARNLSVARDAAGRVWQWGSAPIEVTGIANPGLVISASGLGLVYSDGTVVLWGEPTVEPAGFRQIATQVADVRLVPSADDVDRDGLPDDWEMAHFGDLSHKAADDTDGDALSNVQEFLRGTSPVEANADGDLLPDSSDEWADDYYNAVAPTLVIVGGDGQTGAAGRFNAEPFDLAVWSEDGLGPKTNAPVVFTVEEGGGGLAPESIPSDPGLPALDLRTDADGTVQVFYRHPDQVGVVSAITATAGLSEVTFFSESEEAPHDSDGDGLPDTVEDTIGSDPFNPDTDGDGLPDGWEVANGHDPLVQNAAPDTDGDGVDDYDEFRLGRNPDAGVIPGGGAALNLVVLQPAP